MNISQLAKAVGVSTDTVRYYEKQGLINAPERQANGYRRYTEIEQQIKAKIAQIDAHMVQLKTLKKELTATFDALRCEPMQPVSTAHATAPDSGSGAGVALARRAFVRRNKVTS